jgi:hypothetical protein
MTEAEHRLNHPKGLRIYDIQLDGFRDATQKDLDDLNAVSKAYGKLRGLVAQVHSELVDGLRQIREKYEDQT